jgi:hypothetical protein
MNRLKFWLHKKNLPGQIIESYTHKSPLCSEKTIASIVAAYQFFVVVTTGTASTVSASAKFAAKVVAKPFTI